MISFLRLLPVLFLSLCCVTNSLAANLSLEEIIQQADLIVEGSVSETYEDYIKKAGGQVGPSKDTVVFKFAPKAAVSIRIKKIFKGMNRTGSSLPIISMSDDAADLKNLSVQKTYILFLKKQTPTGLYFILDEGKAQWRVFDYNGEPKVKAWYQATQLQDNSAYQNYDDFVSELRSALRK